MSTGAIIFMILSILILGGGLIASSVNLRNVIRAQKRQRDSAASVADDIDPGA